MTSEPTETYWFTSYAFGWKPATWQGWVIVSLYLLSLLYSFLQTDGTLINFLPQFVLFSLFLLFICIQTGEPRKGK